MLALAEAFLARVAGVGAVPAVARTALAGLALFGLAGYAPTRLLLPHAWRGHALLFVLPVGAAVSGLGLALLGLLRVPLPLALGAVLLAGAAGAVAVRRRFGPLERRPDWPLRVALPLFVATLIGAVSLLPVFRSGFATVHGQNGDAVLAVGVAELLQEAPPTAVRPELPVDRMPLVWRSKVPIYSVLAAISTLSGQDPIVTFSTVSALLFGLTALGLFLLARLALGAGALAAAAVAMLVPLDRIAVYVAIHPYYNQLWGLFALPFVFLFGWRALREPGRRAFATLGLFVALALFAYPLLLPFPAVFGAVMAWRIRREPDPPRWFAALRLPAPRAQPVLWGIAAVLAVPVVAVLVRGVLEKLGAAAAVLAPWTDLAGWSGTALPYLPVGWFFGMEAPPAISIVLVAAVFAAAWLGLRALERAELRAALVATVVAGVLIGAYFYLRGKGQLFYFKSLAFTGPIVVLLAVLGLARLVPRSRWALAGLAALALVLANGARQEIDETYDHASRPVLELREWDRRLPAGASVRIDVPQSGYQLWSWYMLASRPVSALDPLSGFFPHPPQGLRADYVLALRTQPRPVYAFGRPLLRNAQFVLYRLAMGGVKLPDVSTRTLIYDQNRITY